MSRAEFERLAWLLFPVEVARVTGWSRDYVVKLMANGVLRKVQPKGTEQAKVSKGQVANLLGINLAAEILRFVEAEPLLMTPKAVMAWTGYHKRTLEKIAAAGGLTRVKMPGGEKAARYRKGEVIRLIGMGV